MNKIIKTQLNKYYKILPFFLGVILIIILNIHQLLKEETLFHQISSYKTFSSIIGAHFQDIKPLLQGVEYVGYYTNRNLSIPKNNKRYSQAQFVLAPTILDTNNLNHSFVILDCTDKSIVEKKLRQLQAIPIKINQYGIIVAERMLP